jgi:hypothetical protein
MMELLENPDTMEKTPSYYLLPRPNLALSARQDRQARTEPWEQRDHPDQKELPASHHAMEFPVTLEWPANQDPWVDREERGLEVLQELQDV